MASGPHKVRVKIGDAEFEAEGSEEAVKEQYSRFLESLPAAQALAKPQGLPLQQQPPNSNASLDIEGQAEPDGTVKRAFKEDGDLLSLRQPPKGEK